MVVVGGLAGVAAYRAAGRRAGPGGFQVGTEAAGAPGPARTGAVAAASLLGLQEAQQDAVTDREARRGAEEALDTLKDMQLAMLGRGREGASRRLSQLGRAGPDAADPGLRGVQAALHLRIAVEQARQRVAASL